MGEKDIIENTLESYNDVFSDIFNVLLFKGKQIIKESALTDATPYSIFKADGKVREQRRDVAKYWNGTICKLALFGIENQTKVDKTMPLRVLSYDGAAYKTQLTKKPRKPLYPVVTIVLYFGKHKWIKPSKLTESLKIPEELKPFISDYKINIISVGHIPEELRKNFKSDFKHIAEFFYCNSHNIPYKGSKEKIDHFFEVLELLKVFSSDKDIKQLYNQFKGKELNSQEVHNMCFVMEDAHNRGREQGRAEGIAENREEIILKMLEDNLPDENIKQYTGVTTEELEKIKEKLACTVTK